MYYKNMDADVTANIDGYNPFHWNQLRTHDVSGRFLLDRSANHLLSVPLWHLPEFN